jgi:hypothetical protein
MLKSFCGASILSIACTVHAFADCHSAITRYIATASEYNRLRHALERNEFGFEFTTHDSAYRNKKMCSGLIKLSITMLPHAANIASMIQNIKRAECPTIVTAQGNADFPNTQLSANDEIAQFKDNISICKKILAAHHGQ